MQFSECLGSFWEEGDLAKYHREKQTETDHDKQRQTDKDRQRQTDTQMQAGTKKDRQ